jgi:Na+-translocating ferredoxin:NAD+ oxidoreductase RNF subunit RnfB
MNTVFTTIIFAAVLAFALGAILGVFKRIFHVEKDPREARFREALPGANCGSCGYPGCDGYAAALTKGDADIDRCAPGGAAVRLKLSAIYSTGQAVEVQAANGAVALNFVGQKVSGTSLESAKVTDTSVESRPQVRILACRGSADIAPLKGRYTGVASCRAAKLSAGGTKLCAWGCLGYGDCLVVCQFGALSMGSDGLPRVDSAKCVNCGLCARECPQKLFREVPKNDALPVALCSNCNLVKAMVLKTCKAGCIKCELCVKNCPEHCVTMNDGVPLVDYAKCSGCGTCATKCPTKAIQVMSVCP